ncbi:MAG: hypothetical protein ABI175_18415 [Polyangiales bacterium]
MRLEALARKAVESDRHIARVLPGRAGIFAAAQPDGRIGLSVSVVSDLVPLHPLAERLRKRIGAAVARAGLEGELGEIDVTIEDLEASVAARA